MTPFKTEVKDRRLELVSLSLAALSVGAWVRFAWNPSFGALSGAAGYLPLRCPLKLFTGLECPFCGLGRSLLSAFMGNWQRAWDFHPLGPLFLIFGTLLWLGYMISPRRFQAVLAKLTEIQQRLSPRFKRTAVCLVIAALTLQTLSLNAHHLSMISPW